MIIDELKVGIVIDHISAGMGMSLYNHLNLGELDCTVALIKNVPSKKMGKKDIIKIDADISLNLDIIGYIDPGVSVNIIKDGKIAKKFSVSLPETLKNVISCKNPRCITSCEQELDQIFKLSDKESRTYRCLYCESKAE